jgi:hypothetical protein
MVELIWKNLDFPIKIILNSNILNMYTEHKVYYINFKKYSSGREPEPMPQGAASFYRL